MRIQIGISLILFLLICSIDGYLGKAKEVEAKPNGVVIATLSPQATPSIKAEVRGEERVASIEEMIYEVYGDEGRIALAIAKAESGLNKDKCHIDNREYSCGIFQINIRAHFKKIPGKTFEEKAEWLKEPYNNIVTSKFIRATSGWTAWTAYKNKAYLKFM